jgi:hypothetical protein
MIVSGYMDNSFYRELLIILTGIRARFISNNFAYTKTQELFKDKLLNAFLINITTENDIEKGYIQSLISYFENCNNAYLINQNILSLIDYLEKLHPDFYNKFKGFILEMISMISNQKLNHDYQDGICYPVISITDNKLNIKFYYAKISGRFEPTSRMTLSSYLSGFMTLDTSRNINEHIDAQNFIYVFLSSLHLPIPSFSNTISFIELFSMDDFANTMLNIYNFKISPKYLDDIILFIKKANALNDKAYKIIYEKASRATIDESLRYVFDSLIEINTVISNFITNNSILTFCTDKYYLSRAIICIQQYIIGKTNNEDKSIEFLRTNNIIDIKQASIESLDDSTDQNVEPEDQDEADETTDDDSSNSEDNTKDKDADTDQEATDPEDAQTSEDDQEQSTDNIEEDNASPTESADEPQPTEDTQNSFMKIDYSTGLENFLEKLRVVHELDEAREASSDPFIKSLITNWLNNWVYIIETEVSKKLLNAIKDL